VVLKGETRTHEQESLDELCFLADTAGAEVKRQVIQSLLKPDPATYIGKGKAREIKDLAEETGAGFILFDTDLTPAQVKNLERLLEKKIIDRSGIILDIFARRARTREAKLQVELAQLNYYLPRLTRAWTHLSRQEGGIGTRGPGETQLEVDRRAVRRKIAHLEKQLDAIERQHRVRRQGRKNIFKIALVGYTNAGKSSLLNALSGADVFVEDQLFATLDATIRRCRLSDNREVLLIDTVGFIKRLPHHLVASFRSTLNEAREADMFLHVVDVSDRAFMEHIAVVRDVLRDLGIHTKKSIMVFNKLDRAHGDTDINSLKEEFDPVVFTAATRGIGLEDLKKAVTGVLAAAEEEHTVCVSINDSRLIAGLHRLGTVLSTEYRDSTAVITLRADTHALQKIKSLVDHEKDINSDH